MALPRGRRLGEVLVIAVAVILGVSLAVARPSISFGSTQADAKSAVDTARQHATLLVNLSAQNATESLRELGQDATGAWAEQLKADPQSVVKALQKSNAMTVGRVDSVAVSEATKKKTTVMVAASALVSNAAGSKQVTRSYYFVVALVLDGDHWLVSSVETAA